MNKERLGAFIAENRKAMDWTQRDLAEKLHITDKAVSKWERGLSYPDVTLLEPLAAVFGLRMEELMACRKREAEGKEEPMKALLDISKDRVKAERRLGWSRLLGLLALLVVTALAVLYAVSYQSAQNDDHMVRLKETVDGENFLYIVEPGNDDHLLRLKCGGDVDFDTVQLTNEWGEQISYRMSYRWNRWTRRGVVTACEPFGIILGSRSGETVEGFCEPALGYPEVFFCYENYYQDPYSEVEGYRVFLCDVRLWVAKDGQSPDKGLLGTVVDGGSPYPDEIKKTILVVEDCLMAAPWDWDGDGENEVVVRTRWVEKPYTVYDMVDGEIVTAWPDTVPEDLAEALMTTEERAEQYRQMVRAAQGHGSDEAEPDGGDLVL